MNTRARVSVEVLAFVAGVATGVGVSRSSLFARVIARSPAAEGTAVAGPPSLRSVLVDIVRAPSGFLLLGADEHDDRCRVFGAVLRDDYMTVNLAKGAAFLLPYSAINSIDRTQLGTVTVPVIHMVGNPHVKFCAD